MKIKSYPLSKCIAYKTKVSMEKDKRKKNGYWLVIKILYDKEYCKENIKAFKIEQKRFFKKGIKITRDELGD